MKPFPILISLVLSAVPLSWLTACSRQSTSQENNFKDEYREGFVLTRRAFVFGIGKPGSKGEEQCWYGAKSSILKKETDLQVLKHAEALSSRYIKLSELRNLVEGSSARTSVKTELRFPDDCNPNTVRSSENVALYRTQVEYFTAMTACKSSPATDTVECENRALSDGCKSYHGATAVVVPEGKSLAGMALDLMQGWKNSFNASGSQVEDEVDPSTFKPAEKRGQSVDYAAAIKWVSDEVERALGDECPKPETLKFKLPPGM